MEGGRGGRLDETYSEKDGGEGDYSEERKKAYSTIQTVLSPSTDSQIESRQFLQLIFIAAEPGQQDAAHCTAVQCTTSLEPATPWCTLAISWPQ